MSVGFPMSKNVHLECKKECNFFFYLISKSVLNYLPLVGGF